jgi:hypothetical protein
LSQRPVDGRLHGRLNRCFAIKAVSLRPSGEQVLIDQCIQRLRPNCGACGCDLTAIQQLVQLMHCQVTAINTRNDLSDTS